MTNPPPNPGRSRKSTKAGDAAPRRRKAAGPPGDGAVPAAAGLAAAADPNAVGARADGFRTPPERRAMIAEAAYYRAERRGFAPGYEQADWFAAEREIDAALAASRSSPADRPSSAAERGPAN